MSSREKTSLPLVLKVGFLLFLDLSFSKRVRGATVVIDLKETASSRQVIDDRNKSYRSHGGARHLSR